MYNITNFNIHLTHFVPHNIISSHKTSTKTTIAIASLQNAISTSFFYGFMRHPTQNAMSTSFLNRVYASSLKKCNVHIISLWGPNVTHVNDDFHVKMAILALPTHQLLTWSWHVLHVSVYGDHGEPCFMWYHIKNVICYLRFPHVFGLSIITDFRWRPQKQCPC